MIDGEHVNMAAQPSLAWGVGGGVRVTSYTHSTDVRAEWPLFPRCQVYDWPPFLNKKYIMTLFFLDSYVKGPIFLTPWYMHIIFAQRVCLFWYSMKWL